MKYRCNTAGNKYKLRYKTTWVYLMVIKPLTLDYMQKRQVNRQSLLCHLICAPSLEAPTPSLVLPEPLEPAALSLEH